VPQGVLRPPQLERCLSAAPVSARMCRVPLHRIRGVRQSDVCTLQPQCGGGPASDGIWSCQRTVALPQAAACWRVL